MAIKLVLSSEEILNKVFRIVPRGYDALEVDTFLDGVLRDYRKLEESVILSKKEMEDMKEEIKKLKLANQNLEIDLNRYKARFNNIKEEDQVTTDNMDLIKRINVLEKFLYRNGYNPHNIK